MHVDFEISQKACYIKEFTMSDCYLSATEFVRNLTKEEGVIPPHGSQLHTSKRMLRITKT